MNHSSLPFGSEAFGAMAARRSRRWALALLLLPLLALPWREAFSPVRGACGEPRERVADGECGEAGFEAVANREEFGGAWDVPILEI